MADKAKRKRPLIDDDEDDPSSMEKRVRFPKGKKVKKAGSAEGGAQGEEGLDALIDARLAAKERAKRRYQIREEELFKEQQTDISAAEVNYDENAEFEDDGIQIEPFNLEQEREEGYFDENGNYVEYVNRNYIKDAWLDSALVDRAYAEKNKNKTTTEEEYKELSSEDLGKIKRSIANVLQRGETIIQALKRLKGTSGDKKEKMSESTKFIFDQLTEDAMKLLENGEYNVYHEEREVFEQEAEGYERIALARKGIFATAEGSNLSKEQGEDIFSNTSIHGEGSSSIWDGPLGASEANTSLQMSSSDGGDQFDMFGDDEDNTNVNPQSNGTSLPFASSLEQSHQPAPESLDSAETPNEVESDFVYDQSSGYYYSSSLGYYYDPASQLYCCATTGKWYSFDEQSGEYVEFHGADAAAADVRNS